MCVWRVRACWSRVRWRVRQDGNATTAALDRRRACVRTARLERRERLDGPVISRGSVPGGARRTHTHTPPTTHTHMIYDSASRGVRPIARARHTHVHMCVQRDPHTVILLNNIFSTRSSTGPPERAQRFPDAPPVRLVAVTHHWRKQVLRLHLTQLRAVACVGPHEGTGRLRVGDRRLGPEKALDHVRRLRPRRDARRALLDLLRAAAHDARVGQRSGALRRRRRA